MPLAIALLNTSNPSMGAMDMLSRLSHDSDVDVGASAVLAMGAPAADVCLVRDLAFPDRCLPLTDVDVILLALDEAHKATF